MGSNELTGTNHYYILVSDLVKNNAKCHVIKLTAVHDDIDASI